MRWQYAAILVVAATGCNVAYRTQDGGAMTKPGVAGGTTRSIYIGDRGGILTKLGIAGLTGVAMFGAVSNVHTSESRSRTYDSQGRAWETTTRTTTYTVDRAKAEAIGKGGEQMAKDAEKQAKPMDVNESYGGLSAGLEIAARRLGGDTSGWMFDFGWKGTWRRGAWGLRSSAKLGFGKYTFHDREVRRSLDTASAPVVRMEDSTYTFFGLPLRLGVAYRGVLEAFAQVDLNAVTAVGLIDDDQTASPSPWRVGARATVFRYVYAELTYAFSSMRAADTSTMLEVGLEF